MQKISICAFTIAFIRDKITAKKDGGKKSMVILKADLNNPVQENFCGLGAVLHGFAGMPDDANRVYTEEQCILEADRAAELRVKGVRSYFSWYAWDAETDTWDWDNERSTVFYNWARRLKERGIDIAINTGWWNVGDLMGDWHMGPCPFTKKGDWKATVDGYAQWVSDVYTELVEKRGLDNIKYFCLFTEPNENICPSLPYENAKYRDVWYDCAHAAHLKLVADGKRDKIKLLGPQEGMSNRPWFTEWAIKEKHVDEWLDGFTMHNYLPFREASPEDIHSGNKSLLLHAPGCRSQQEVTLKKNTDYKLSIWIKHKAYVESTENSRVLFGVFGKGSFDHYYTDYCTPQDAIYARSVYTKELANEWRRFEMTFNSGDLETANICVYSEVFRADGKRDNIWAGLPFLNEDGVCVLVDDFSLREVGSDVELLQDNSFEQANTTRWYTLWAKSQYNDPYLHWCDTEKDPMSILPGEAKKRFWHDEYNASSCKKQDKDYGILLALGQIAMMNNGGQGSFMWTLFDQQWPNNHTNSADAFVDGVHLHGLMPCLLRNDVPYPTYYAWGLISRYTGGEGTKCYAGVTLSPERVVMNVNELPDGNFTVSVVNYGETQQDIKIKLNRYLDRNFYRHTFNSETIVPDENAKLAGIDKTFEKVIDTIEDTLPAMSIAVYTTLTD